MGRVRKGHHLEVGLGPCPRTGCALEKRRRIVPGAAVRRAGPGLSAGYPATRAASLSKAALHPASAWPRLSGGSGPSLRVMRVLAP
jgi:hypothetical protein